MSKKKRADRMNEARERGIDEKWENNIIFSFIHDYFSNNIDIQIFKYFYYMHGDKCCINYFSTLCEVIYKSS